MEKKIELVRIFHRDRWRVGIRHAYDPEINSRVKAIPGAVYSGTNKFWYIDDRPGAEEFIAGCLGQGFRVTAAGSGEVVQNQAIQKPVEKPVGQSGSLANDIPAEPACTGSAPKPDSPPQKPAPPAEKILPPQQQFTAAQHPLPPAGEILPRPQQLTAAPQQRGCRVEIGNVPGSRKMMVKFHGLWEKEWIDEMKQYGFVEYLKERKEWRLPWSRMAIDSLCDYFSARGLRVEVLRNRQPEGIKNRRDAVAAEVRLRTLPEASAEAVRLLEAHISEKRQSTSTVKTYSAMLQLFLKYHDNLVPGQITAAHVSSFMNDFVLPLGYSASFQNQMITAIKTYYSIVNSPIDLGRLLRPKRSRALPKVFSKDEVMRILNGTLNLKHRLILWLIYSCGLRRAEVINIKLTDLDRDRGILHIRQGKGKVDRIVPVSAKVWDKIDEYTGAFAPKEYLFEGQYGGRYTATSVYNVFRRAMRKAGIRKEVGVHALRHSYATHLHEGGLDIRFIQELLGHRSSRTTEVYTHVSRRNLMAVKSPIDDLDVK